MLIAADNDTVTELNERARTDLVADGTVDDHHTVALRDGTRAGRGDRIVTREIDRYIADGTGAGTAGKSGRRSDGFVRNGQLWTVDRVPGDGALTVRLLAPDGTASAPPASRCPPSMSPACATRLRHHRRTAPKA